MNTLPAELVVVPGAGPATERSSAATGRADREPPPPQQQGLQEAGTPEVGVLVEDPRHAAWKNFPKDMVAGALLGGVAHTIVAPVERAKLLLQTQDINMVVRDGRHPRYKGLVDCIYRVAKNEGFLSLWRGNGTGVMRYYPSLAINFACKDFYRTILTESDSVRETKVPSSAAASPSSLTAADFALSRAPANFLAGAMAGCTSLLVVYPLDIAHTRLAADIGRETSRQFRGIRDFLSTVYAKDGVRGVYRGFPASLQGMVLHRSVYFGAFDTAKDYMSGAKPDQIPFLKRWLTAQAATTSAGLISYPLDTVRRRMMMQAGLEQQMYTSTLDCWKTVFKTEGVLAFYKGALTNMVRGTGAAMILVLYDEVKNFMHAAVPTSLDAIPASKSQR